MTQWERSFQQKTPIEIGSKFSPTAQLALYQYPPQDKHSASLRKLKEFDCKALFSREVTECQNM
jgi:hypothetical protein